MTQAIRAPKIIYKPLSDAAKARVVRLLTKIGETR